MALEEEINSEVRAAQSGHDVFGGVHVALADWVIAAPTLDSARWINGIGTKGRGMGKRDHEMNPRPHDPM